MKRKTIVFWKNIIGIKKRKIVQVRLKCFELKQKMFMKKKNLFQDVLKINNLNKKLQYFNDVYDYFSKYMLKSLSIYQK